jgi:hypothetical protein
MRNSGTSRYCHLTEYRLWPGQIGYKSICLTRVKQIHQSLEWNISFSLLKGFPTCCSVFLLVHCENRINSAKTYDISVSSALMKAKPLEPGEQVHSRHWLSDVWQITKREDTISPSIAESGRKETPVYSPP